MDKQTYAQLNALRLQARLTQLDQIKLRLETLLRGHTMNLRDNALPPNAANDKVWVMRVVNQICGDTPSEEQRSLVTDLVTKWMDLETSMQKAYEEVERALKQ